MRYDSVYVSGTYFAKEMGVYCGWTAHKESFAAGQLFFNEQRDIVLLLSGECFAGPEKRAELKQRGHELGEGSGSWLVHFYEEEGDQFFEKLNGLFSGLLIDKRQNKAFLFNDRYGLERIYWYETESATYFASEAKALLRILPELRSFDDEGVAQYLTFGCTVEERTLFRGIRLLPGASVWSFENGRCNKRKYFSSEMWETQPILAPEAFESEFQETFKRILPAYIESGPKLGISLTGGLDTRMIMACCPADNPPLCYSFSGEKWDTLDVQLAARIAKACGAEHHILRVGADFLADFLSHLDRTVYLTDGCLGGLGAHEVYMNRQARQLARVRLTGNYGSEIFRNASMLKPIGHSAELFNGEFHRVLASSVRPLIHGNEHAVSLAVFKQIPWSLFGYLAAARSQINFRTPYVDNELVALAFRAPESLRKSPLQALRMVNENRPPLGEIPTDMGMLLQNRGMVGASRRLFSKITFKLDYLYHEGLPGWLSSIDPLFDWLNSPSGLLGRHKYLPYRRWFRRELAPQINEVLTDARVRRMRFWNPSILERLAADHIKGRRNYVQEINAVLTLEAVERLFFRDTPTVASDLKNSANNTLQKECLLPA